MSLLTIKHIEKSGREGVQQAHSVSFNPGDGSTETSLEAFGCTGIGGPVDTNGWCKYTSGKVYIMNDAGSTVAAYDMN